MSLSEMNKTLFKSLNTNKLVLIDPATEYSDLIKEKEVVFSKPEDTLLIKGVIRN